MIAGAKLTPLRTFFNGQFDKNKFLLNIVNNLKKYASIKVIIVSFPSNPTAQIVDLDFYKELVKIAKKYQVYILSDLAYSEIYFGKNPPPSILEVNEQRV